MDTGPVIVDVASDWGGCTDERLRRAFLAAAEFIWGIGPPPALLLGTFLETGELSLACGAEYGATRSALGRIAMAVRAYLPVETGTVLQWHQFEGRYCLRLVASDREDALASELFRRYASVLTDGAVVDR